MVAGGADVRYQTWYPLGVFTWQTRPARLSSWSRSHSSHGANVSGSSKSMQTTPASAPQWIPIAYSPRSGHQLVVSAAVGVRPRSSTILVEIGGAGRFEPDKTGIHGYR